MEVRASLRRALIIGAACAVPLHISTQRYIWRSTAQACDNMPNAPPTASDDTDAKVRTNYEALGFAFTHVAAIVVVVTCWKVRESDNKETDKQKTLLSTQKPSEY